MLTPSVASLAPPCSLRVNETGPFYGAQPLLMVRVMGGMEDGEWRMGNETESDGAKHDSFALPWATCMCARMSRGGELRMSTGANLAKKKKAVLVDAKTNEKEGVKYYTFVFKAGDDKKGAREVLFLLFVFAYAGSLLLLSCFLVDLSTERVLAAPHHIVASSLTACHCNATSCLAQAGVPALHQQRQVVERHCHDVREAVGKAQGALRRHHGFLRPKTLVPV